MQVSSRWLKLCCSLEFGDCGVAVGVQAGVQAQDTSEGTVCFRIVWSNSHSLARLRFGIFQLAVLSKRNHYGKCEFGMRERRDHGENARMRLCIGLLQ